MPREGLRQASGRHKVGLGEAVGRLPQAGHKAKNAKKLTPAIAGGQKCCPPAIAGGQNYCPPQLQHVHSKFLVF